MVSFVKKLLFNKMSKNISIIISIIGIYLSLSGIVFAATDGVYNISLDNVGFAGGEESTDGTYNSSDTIGTPLVGLSSDGTNYSSQDGFWYMVNNTISLSLNSATKDLGVVVAGTPNTATTIATVITDSAGGYDLFISNNHELIHTNDGTTTIASYAGTITTPTAWSGAGFGFSIINGSDVDEAKWGSSPNNKYAGIPTVDTMFYNKSGYTSGADNTTIEYKIDVPSSQKSGLYTNTVTYTAMSKL